MLLLLSFLLSSTVPPALSREGASGVDEQAFLVSLPELARLGDGQRFAFRYRTVQFGEQGEERLPTIVRDGVLRLEYRPDGVLVEEVIGSYSEEFGYEPTHETRRGYYSLQSGEYVLASRWPGSTTDLVTLDRWQAPPKVAYLALGLLGPHLADDVLRVGESFLDSTRKEVVFAYRGKGETVTLTYDSAGGGRMERMRVDGPDGRALMVLDFLGREEAVPGGPARPTMIVESVSMPASEASRVTIWSALEGEWARGAIPLDLPIGSELHDWRVDGFNDGSVVTDRPLDLISVSAWAPIAAGSKERDGCALHDHQASTAAGGGETSPETGLDSAPAAAAARGAPGGPLRRSGLGLLALILVSLLLIRRKSS